MLLKEARNYVFYVFYFFGSVYVFKFSMSKYRQFCVACCSFYYRFFASMLAATVAMSSYTNNQQKGVAGCKSSELRLCATLMGDQHQSHRSQIDCAYFMFDLRARARASFQNLYSIHFMYVCSFVVCISARSHSRRLKSTRIKGFLTVLCT